MAYGTEAQLSLAFNTRALVDLADDNKDGVADTGILAAGLAWSSRTMWAILYPRFSAVTAMNPESYTSGAYPVLDSMCILLTIDWLKHRQGREKFEYDKHPTIQFCKDVAMGYGSIPAA